MNAISLRLSAATAAVFAGLLSGCVTARQEHQAGGMTDPKAMCEMHKKMMGTNTAAEQQRMMEEHMKAMTPEMRKHMQMMQEQCK
jgi:hypothetical protein